MHFSTLAVLLPLALAAPVIQPRGVQPLGTAGTEYHPCAFSGDQPGGRFANTAACTGNQARTLNLFDVPRSNVRAIGGRC